MILAVSTDIGACGDFSGQDEISFVCFKDIESGTEIDFTDNGWEKSNAGVWGDNEGVIRANRTGGIIPAGTVITFRTTSAGSFTCVYPDSDWSFGSMAGNGVFDLDNLGDQVFIMQEGDWLDPAGIDNADYTGKVLFGASTCVYWEANGSENQSNLYPYLDCFSIAASSIGVTSMKFSYPLLEATSKKHWLERTKSTTNWTDYSNDCVAFHNDFPNYTSGLSIEELSGSFVSGKWNGNIGTDWFDCSNWDNLTVPKGDVDVTIDNMSANGADINLSSPLAVNYSLAECGDLHIFDHYLGMYGDNAVLTINGNLDMDGVANFNASAVGINSAINLGGQMDIGSGNTFDAGSSEISLIGADQAITGTGVVEAEKLTLAQGVKSLEGVDLRVNQQLILDGAVLKLQGNDLIIRSSASGALVANNNGVIISETSPDNYSTVYWNIGNTLGTYVIPFATDEPEPQSLRLEYNIQSLGSGGSMGVVKFATYPTDAYNVPMPENVNQLTNDFGKDNYHHVIDRFWLIDNEIGDAGFTTYPVIKYTFTYSDDDWSDGVNIIEENQLVAQRYNDDMGTWHDWLYSATADPNSNKLSITLGGGEDYKEIWTLSDDSDPLPIELISFSASCNVGVVDVKWTTASETNNNHFEIERSDDGQTFETVAEIDGANTSNLVIDYTASDDSPLAKIAYYRLKQVDYDGDYDYSSLVSVEPCAVAEELSLHEVFFDEVNISASVFSQSDQVMIIRLFDPQGRMVIDKRMKMKKGFNQIKVPVSLSNPGAYFFSIAGEFDMVSKKVLIW